MTSPSITHRAQKMNKKKIQNGTVVSITTVVNPPADFSKKPRDIALIELEDGTKTLSCIISKEKIEIGQTVRPRMRLHRINNQGLRIYDV